MAPEVTWTRTGLTGAHVGIGIAFCLVPGWILLEVLGYSKAEIFQNLVYWACFLLICAVHALSKRTDKAALETNALRGEIEDARGEIRRLQSDLRELQGSQHNAARLSSWSPVKSVPGVALAAIAAPRSTASGPREAAVKTASPTRSFEALWGPALLALFFLLIKFWPEVGALVKRAPGSRAVSCCVRLEPHGPHVRRWDSSRVPSASDCT
jgi:hypothetical protein